MFRASVWRIEVDEVSGNCCLQCLYVVTTHKGDTMHGSTPCANGDRETGRVHSWPRHMKAVVELSVSIESDDAVDAGSSKEAQI